MIGLKTVFSVALLIIGMIFIMDQISHSVDNLLINERNIMKKKLIYMMMVGILFVSIITGCESQSTHSSRDDDRSEDDDRNEKEDEDADEDDERNGLASLFSSHGDRLEPETFPDDEIIIFEDENFEYTVRELTGIEEGDITYGDVKNIEEFGMSWNYALTEMTPMKYFTGLHSLTVYAEVIPDLTSLYNCRELEHLDFWADGLSSIDGVQYLSKLEELDLYVGVLELEDINPLKECKNLNSLILHGGYVVGSANVFEEGEPLPDGWGSITDLGVLSACNKLTVLELEGCDSLTDISVIAKLPNLETFDLMYCRNVTDLSALQKCPNLQTITLSYLNEEVNLDVLSECDSLSRLTLWCSDGIKTLDFLSGCDGLRTLDIARCNDMYSLEGLEGCSLLRYLDIRECDMLITLYGVEGCTSLEDVRITYCDNLTDASALMECDNLEDLEISSCEYMHDVGGEIWVSNREAVEKYFNEFLIYNRIPDMSEVDEFY